MQPLILVSLIEDATKGQVIDRREWPLHVTVMPWFKVQDHQAFSQELADILSTAKPIPIQIGQKEMFGKNKNVPVNVVVPIETLTSLHHRLLQLVKKYGDIEKGEYIGRDYRAHVTHFEDRLLAEGREVILSNISLAELTDPLTCKIIEEYEL